MNRSQQIEVIRAACVKAKPEIVELKFGCLIVGSDGNEIVMRVGGDMGNEILQVVDAKTHEAGGYFSGYVEDENGESRLETAEDWVKDGRIKIIGRPVRLADVLLAIKLEKHLEKHGDFLFFHTEHYAYSWNLRADDLNAQTNECVSFLYELVK